MGKSSLNKAPTVERAIRFKRGSHKKGGSDVDGVSYLKKEERKTRGNGTWKETETPSKRRR